MAVRPRGLAQLLFRRNGWSSQLLLVATQQALTSVEQNMGVQQLTHAQAQVLTDVLRNLDSRDDWCRITASSSLIVFSCGHIFTRDTFATKILSEFTGKLRKRHRPVLARVLRDEYSKCLIACACPACVAKDL
jgi:hypothetical protein